MRFVCASPFGQLARKAAMVQELKNMPIAVQQGERGAQIVFAHGGCRSKNSTMALLFQALQICVLLLL